MFWRCPDCKWNEFSHLENCGRCGQHRPPPAPVEPRIGPRFVKHNAPPPPKPADPPKQDPDPPNDPGHYGYY